MGKKELNFSTTWRPIARFVFGLVPFLAACEAALESPPAASITTSTLALDTELVTNGDFTSGANGWYLGQYGGASSGTVENEAYQITVGTAGSQWWHVQFQQGGLPLEQGKTYILAFDVYKGPENSGTQLMEINVGEDGGDYTGYFNGHNKEVTLTTTPTHYAFEFEMLEPDDGAARIEFNCGRYTGTYYLDNVSLTEVSEEGVDVDPSSFALFAGVDAIVTDTLTLTNTGAAPVTWRIVATETWLTVNPASGTLAAGAAATLTITADSHGLAVGDHMAELDLTHNAPTPETPFTVDVDFEVKLPYTPTSPYLINPALAIGFVDDTAQFRLKARDEVNGGFYSFIDRQGNPVTSQNIKSMCGQSRYGYAFVRAFMLTGNEAYLDHARHALKFLYDHGYNNGWYFVTDNAGNYISHWGHDNWWSFQQHYALVGISAMVEATGGNTNWGDGTATDSYWLNVGVNSNYTRLWDSNAATEGYFEYASTNWSNKWDKGFTPTVDGITTHALLLAMMTDDAAHDARLFQLADNILDHMAGNMSISAVGFPEYFFSDWSVDYGYGASDIGHIYKTSWVLQRAYLMDTSRTEYDDAAQAMMWDLWNGGAYDAVNQGPYSVVQWQSGAVTNKNKNHWMVEQGVTSGLINYYAATAQTDKDMYLEVADGSLSFFMDHMIDPVYGESYADVSEDGSTVVTADKGGLFTAGYHSIELGYYVYLYGNLYYHGAPVSLYYRYPAESAARSYKLTPVAIEDSVLKILSVEHNGAVYNDFDGDSRTLNLPAGVGGVFKVTFGTESSCGDGVCSDGEDCSTCPGDCGQCSSCGDGTCDTDEDCASCPADCGQCEYCGDGTCNNGEDCASCPADCGQCGGCTCPNGCNAVVNATVPTVVDGAFDTCYFFDSLGGYINNWNNVQVDINGVDITNSYMGRWSYPAEVNGGYYIYLHGNYPWSHLEVR